MIAHVAEAGEARGRVVLQFSSGRPSAVAIEAAICVAQAFQSEVESLFVEDRNLIDLASFPFAREISFDGRAQRAISCSDIERDLRLIAQAVQRRVEILAHAADVPFRQRTVRDEPVNALAVACRERGPWNVVALAEPFGATACDTLRQLLETVSGTTGLVLVGPQARRTVGPVVMAIEDTERLPGMLRAAERLTPVTGGEIIALLVAEDEDTLHWMDGETRLLLAERQDVRIAHAGFARGASAAVAETLRLLGGGFVIGRFGGLVVPSDGDLRPLAAALECPLFLVR